MQQWIAAIVAAATATATKTTNRAQYSAVLPAWSTTQVVDGRREDILSTTSSLQRCKYVWKQI